MKDKQALAVVHQLIKQHGFTVDVEEPDRVYGASVMLTEDALDKFVELYFPGFQLEPPNRRNKMSPKFLLVDAHMRLSWQYHHRRSEHWVVIRGPVGVIISETDEETPQRTLEKGEHVIIAQGERHRLVGLDATGVIAEIWSHADPNHPSDELDCVRLQDDYNRPQRTSLEPEQFPH
jgi:mannose-6-phosphate isomerase